MNAMVTLMIVGTMTIAAVGCTVIVLAAGAAVYACCWRVRRWVRGRAVKVEGLRRVLG